MMKKIGLFLSAIAILVSSCADKNAYTLDGTVKTEEANGKAVYLQELKEDGSGFNNIDTAKVENGKFTFKGIAGDAPQMRFVSVEGGAPALFVLEPGTIKMLIDSLTMVEGTTNNDAFQRFANARDEINVKLRAIGQKHRDLSEKGELTAEAEEKLMDEFEGFSKEISGILFEYTKVNMNSPIGEFFFKMSANAFDEKQQKELLSLASPELKADERVKQLEEHLTILENSAIGKQFIDVKGLTPDGKEIALSDYAGKGKVVLIDFWASWCGPCIKEMPVVIEAYKKYKAKGFEIVGISLDQDGDAWKTSIKDLSITWPQMSDLKAWNSDLSKVYGVRSIPHTILLDKDGKIVEKDLRGQKLLSALDELLK
ncbi:AhpC/TSA family protein [Dysgonomonas sp. 216]|uniref:TlpA disulfide reductase family protein n=1 Tax=Dysgonomonas sp. 216 TaxID=2302934 RepID=UPI0013D235E0|nr:TlpA disulfide reductase family protein [Dysgonomonas sp. 216]NDW17964.1 AhpC/TSA family protein [Dysgonomonas sp. 216]